jgi:hypothetical protein
MTLRLTLRTLLSYLDDTLEPAQAKAIGAKVVESEQARELMERIKQVTRRRRLMTPPTSGPGGIDGNTIAEYLDNEVTPEQAAEVEQICLASDVHLAEVAACHQILTLVLGEPALVPPSAKQRMYALVKGPESIPFRKPLKPAAKIDQDLSSEIEPDRDDTLRLGVPAVGGGHRNLWLLAGGGVLAACLLVVAVWQLMRTPTDPRGTEQIVLGDNNRDKEKEKEKDKDLEKANDAGKGDEKKKLKDPKNTKDDKPPPPKKDDLEPGRLPITDVKVEKKIETSIPYHPASLEQAPIGKYVIPGVKDPSVLLQAKANKNGWARLVGKNAPVSSGRMLLSLSGSKSVIMLDSGVELTLWGNLPEETRDWSVLESRAIVHVPSPQLDADLTLDRGRILLRNLKKDGHDALIRLRFSDSTQGKEDFFDVTLLGGQSAVIIDRSGVMDRNEPFYVDKKAVDRKGPTTIMKLFALENWARIRRDGGAESSLSEGQQPMLQWDSIHLVLGPPEGEKLPKWIKGIPELKEAAAKADRENAVRAHVYLAKLLETKSIDLALSEIEQKVQEDAKREISTGKGITADTFTLWRHTIRCRAAIDDIATLYDEFAQEPTPIFIRGLCLQTLQQWIALQRDNDYELLDVVRKYDKKNKFVPIKIMELFHSISDEDARKPATYQLLIEGLTNDLLPIRTLCHWHLLHLRPAGVEIAYDPAMSRERRVRAAREWTDLIAAAPKKKEKKG